MLTPKQIEDARKQLGINTDNPTSPTASTLIERLEAKSKPTRNFAEKLASVTGGEKIAQGIGQAIANPKIAKENEEAMTEAIKQQGELLKRKKEITELGGDTSAIDKGLEYNKQNLDELGGGLENLLNQKKLTGKQVVGDALQLATTVTGAGALKGAKAGKLVGTESILKTTTKVTGAIKGAIQGAKAGSIAGGAYGASSGVSESLKQDGSAQDIALGGLKGAAIGAGTGGVLGGVAGGVSGGVKSIKKALAGTPKKESDFVLDLVAPKATEKVKQQAIAQGRVSEQGLFKASKILPSKRDNTLAESIKGVVSSKKSVIQNVDALDKAVSKINTNVKSYVKKNKVPFNTNQLKSQLNKGKSELKLVFASDKQAEKTYDAVVKEFIKHVEKKDTAGLLDARQAFDKIPAIRKLLESQGLGENVKKEIVLTARLKGNEYIASLLPKGNKYRADLLKESHMLEVIGNIAEKNTKEIGINKIQALTNKYPILKGFVGGALTTAGLGAVGVGGAAILSSD